MTQVCDMCNGHGHYVNYEDSSTLGLDDGEKEKVCENCLGEGLLESK